MNNVEVLRSSVKASVDDVCQFATNMGERGDYTKSTAKQLPIALKKLSGVLQEDEPCDPQALLDGLDNLARRFATKNPTIKRATVATYVSRAKRLLDDYIAFSKDPTKFQVRPRSTKKATPPAKPKKGASSTPSASGTELRTFPLPGGRVVKFELPEGWSRDDAARFVLHLLTLASDFQPADLKHFVFTDSDPEQMSGRTTPSTWPDETR